MYEALISDLQERLKCFPPDEFHPDYCRIRSVVEALEAINNELAALQAENVEKDREIARLSEQLEADSQLKSGLSNANALCSMYKATLSRVEAERDAAKKCIYDIETYLAFGSAQYIGRTIQAWKSGAQGEENDGV